MARPVICTLAVLALNLACSGPYRAFGEATVAVTHAKAAREDGDLNRAARMYRQGAAGAGLVLEKHAQSDLAKGVKEGTIKLGPYTYRELVDVHLPRALIWTMAPDSILATAAALVEKADELSRPGLFAEVAAQFHKAGYETEAVVAVRSARADAGNLEEPWDRANELVGLAAVQIEIKDVAGAIATLRVVLDGLLDLDESEDVSDILGLMADSCVEMGRQAESLELLNLVADAVLDDPNPNTAAMLMPDIAYAMAELGFCGEAADLAMSIEPLDESYEEDDLCGCDYYNDYEEEDGEDGEDSESEEDQAYQEELLSQFTSIMEVFDLCLENDREAAMEMLTDILDMARESTDESVVQDAVWACVALGEFEEAKDLVDAVEGVEEHVRALLTLADELNTEEHPERAEAVVAELRQIDLGGLHVSNQSGLYRDMASYYKSMGFKDEALGALDRTLDATLTHADAEFQMGQLAFLARNYQALGATDKAVLVLHKLELAMGGGPNAVYKLNALQSLVQTQMIARHHDWLLAALKRVVVEVNALGAEYSAGPSQCWIAGMFAQLDDLEQASQAVARVTEPAVRAGCLQTVASALAGNEERSAEAAEYARRAKAIHKELWNGPAGDVGPRKTAVEVARAKDCLGAVKMVAAMPIGDSRTSMLAQVGGLCEKKGVKLSDEVLGVLKDLR